MEDVSRPKKDGTYRLILNPKSLKLECVVFLFQDEFSAIC